MTLEKPPGVSNLPGIYDDNELLSITPLIFVNYISYRRFVMTMISRRLSFPTSGKKESQAAFSNHTPSFQKREDAATTATPVSLSAAFSKGK
jgi:hypothetical protein